MRELCPECANGKCVNCTGWSLGPDDAVTDCRHVEGGMHQ